MTITPVLTTLAGGAAALAGSLIQNYLQQHVRHKAEKRERLRVTYARLLANFQELQQLYADLAVYAGKEAERTANREPVHARTGRHLEQLVERSHALAPRISENHALLTLESKTPQHATILQTAHHIRALYAANQIGMGIRMSIDDPVMHQLAHLMTQLQTQMAAYLEELDKAAIS